MPYVTYSNKLTPGEDSSLSNIHLPVYLHIQGSKNVVLDALSSREYADTHMDANDTIDTYPDLGVICIPGRDQSSSAKQTRVTYIYNHKSYLV